ncbi:hydrogenase maturation protease [Actinoplanes sp. NPDC049599]|uniref:hydrogenase maturation protease n=1 Tax=Actinoplanes sp. NPDC049599 TaxID=3363903 RepID=UPI00378C75AB
MTSRGAGRRVVIGVGNEYRRDDGFGPLVVSGLIGRQAADRRLAEVELRFSDGEPTRLLDLWTGAAVAVVVDAVLDDAGHAGRHHELVLDALDALGAGGPAGSHAVGLGSTVALGRALDRLPGRLVVLAVSGTDFGFGQGLTAPVAAAVPPVTERVCVLVG